MENDVKKITLAVCAAMLCTSAFSCGNTDRGTGTGHMFDVPLLGDPESLDPQFASDPSSATVIKNLYSGLMMTDSSGAVKCCNAESYDISEDGTVYTFTLRQDNYWFYDTNSDDVIDDEECFNVTAEDYVFALQRVLDPKMQSPYAEEFSCIKGASEIAEGLISAESAEVYAVDRYTLMIVLEHPCAEFLRLLCSAGAYPCNKEFFLSTKGRYGLDDRSVMSNGAFYVRQWFYDPYGVNNILFMRRNGKNWTDDYEIAPSYLSFYIQRSEEEVRAAFKDESIECFTSMSSSPYNPKKYYIEGIPATTLGLIFNPEDKYYSNLSLRMALAKSIDRDSLESQLKSDVQCARGVIPPAVSVLGRSYRELSSDRQFDEFDKEKALELYAQAKQELGTESIETVKILVNAETVDSGYLHSLSQRWQELFGSYIGIEDVTAEQFEERIAAGDYSIALYPVRGELPLGSSCLRQFETVERLRSEETDELGLTEKVMSCPDPSELVEAYTSAERELLGQYTFIPLFYKNSYLIADRDNEQIVYDPFTGAVDYRQALNYS
ncbi:MAG: peptide ABC transporter substrate-binding protein [Ruminococcus sp.]|nr:peptide ABC transporter substrate-binding protein [Ruminococcus sp.]